MSPTSLPSSEAVDSGSADQGTTKRKRILLVAGDGFTRLVLLLRLRLAGFAVDFTSNGVLGLGKLRSCRPDVLLVELRLCGLSGLELIKAARAEQTFGNRPIYVFTYADRMNRTTRQEVAQLATKVFDKSSISREDLVQTFVTTFLKSEPTKPKQPTGGARPEAQATMPIEIVPPGVIEEIIAGVREQTELLNKETQSRSSGGVELLSRVSSLASCADAAGLPNLARQARALENFLKQLCRTEKGPTDAALGTVTRAVNVMSHMPCETGGSDQDLTRFRAVVVDEAAGSNRALKEKLQAAGFEPACFEEPPRALEYLAANATDLIVANVRLPEAHGLALADIRQLPLHAETPVLFGSETTQGKTSDWDLPTSASRLDEEPVSLAEMIVRALNEVQGADAVGGATQSPVRPEVVADQALIDGFDLFALPGEQEQLPRHQVFAVESIPNQPFQRAEEGAPGVDSEAESVSRLPATTFEGTQADEHAVEALSPSAFLVEPEQAPQPEPTIENQAVQFPETAEEPAIQGEVMKDHSLQNHLAQPGWDGIQSSRHMAAATPTEGTMVEEQTRARCAELEQEIATLRQVFADFNGSFGEQQQAADDTSKHVQDLEARLSQTAADLEREQQERQQVEADLRHQLEAAKATGEPAEAARLQAETRCAELEQELAKLRQAHQELSNKLAQTPQADAKDTDSGRQGVAALARATAELAKERGERQRSQQRGVDLNQRLQALHDDLKRTLEAQREDQQRMSTLDEEHRQTLQELDRRTADVEQHQAERELTEDQLQKAKEENAQLRKDLSFYEESNKRFGGGRLELQTRLEASLNAAREKEARLNEETTERQRLAESLDEAQREMQAQGRKRERLEQELQAAQEALQDRETKLQKEIAERQRLNEALRSVQGNAQDRSERDLELTKLQSNLELEQVERKRQETQLARIRQKAVNASHAARALRTSLRRQIREPVENLAHSARSLLETEMGDDQKRLAEAVLQDVLLVQTRLREPESPQTDSTEAAEPPTAPET